jgi:hypothetical protein
LNRIEFGFGHIGVETTCISKKSGFKFQNRDLNFKLIKFGIVWTIDLSLQFFIILLEFN